MITIVCSTNRDSSISRVVSEFYQKLLTEAGASSTILDLKDLPADFTSTAMYKNTGKNESFNQLGQLIRDSEKFVFVVPEYNGSFPGVLKAFIDCIYPDHFKDKKCALVGLSAGVMGGALALSHLTDIFNYLGMHVLSLKVRLPGIRDYLDNGQVTHDLYLELLELQVKDLINF